MKKLLLLTICTATSLSGFSQTDINDTIIGLPKSVVRLIVKDLVQSDSDREELRICNEVNDRYDNALRVCESLTKTHEEKIKSMRESIDSYETLTDEQTGRIVGLERKLKRRTATWRTVAIAAVAGIMVNHFSWKYGK